MMTREYKKIEDVLCADGEIIELPVGRSMWPMLRNRRDHIVLSRLDSEPAINDVVLYKRPNGRYVLHRVLKVEDGEYVIRGDNCLCREFDVKREYMLGTLKGFYRDDKYIDCANNRWYRFYVRFWRAMYPVRVPFMAASAVIRKLGRMISASKSK